MSRAARKKPDAQQRQQSFAGGASADPTGGGETASPIAADEAAAAEAPSEAPSEAALARQDAREGGGGLLDTVLDKVINGLDLEGLASALATRVANKVLASVREEDVVEALAARVETALGNRLCDRIAARLLGG